MKKELWLRLRNYHFDQVVLPQMFDHVLAAFGRTDASTKAFASKIARKHDWTNAFSRRAVQEYKKFVYLGMVSDFPVTPPRAIDQVWHEHILFSRAYREFCRDVLRRDFDHNPELLPSAEQSEAFKAQYDATLNLYEREFNRVPPVDIWGTPKFAAARGARREEQRESLTGPGAGDAPLFVFFDGETDSAHTSEFGGGGEFSGGGGGSSWGDAPSGDGGSASDSGSDSGGSGCSSGCGGGGE